MDEEIKPVDATTDATDMPVDEGTEVDETEDEAPIVADPEETA